MSNYIVLVKQVPDVMQITDNAFDPETGTLIRSRLASVINELDTQALAMANHMRKISGDSQGKIVCLTMGPRTAEEVLRYGLSRCADAAVLLSDARLAGADTCATANPLAYAIRKTAKEVLEAGNDYYIVCGMQSGDGDTAQVPAQVAEELGVVCVAYVTGVEYKDGRFEFTRIISGGSQRVAAKCLPCVITVAKYEYPLFAGFAATRYANRMKILEWSADDIKADHIGMTGSKTRVIRVFPPGKSARKCRQVNDVRSLAALIIKSFETGPENEFDGKAIDSRYVLPARRADNFDRSYEGIRKDAEDYKILSDKLKELNISDASRINDEVKQKILAAAGEHFHAKALEDLLAGLTVTKPTYSGDVLVVAEHRAGKIHPATFELIGKARELANSLEVHVGAVIAGSDVEKSAKELIAGGANNVYLIENELLAEFEPGLYRKVLVDAIRKYSPQIVLFAATPQGRVLAPMVAYRIGCGLTADCTGLDIRDGSRRGQIATLMQTRPALGGNVMATICTKDSKMQMATARPGVMKSLEPDYTRKGSVIRHEVALSTDDISIEIIDTEFGEIVTDLAGSELIVSGGKGMQNRDTYEKLVGSLCQALSRKLGTHVERGASRAAVEHGFAERAYQVGQTGTSVGPKIYLALGISGAIQHMIGISKSWMIVAINNAPTAPILKQCDYYMVGGVEQIVPELVKQLEAEQK